MKLSGILRTFYKSGLRYIPVIRPGTGKTGLVGFIPRERLDREMSDLNRAEQEIDRIPERLYHYEKFPEELYIHFSGTDGIPVLNTNAQEEDPWSEEDLLYALAHHRSENKPPPAIGKPEASLGGVRDQDSIEWLSRMILSAMPYPLYAADLKGHTLFYNELFEKRLLDGDVFKRSIATAESFLREILTDFLARAAASGEPTDTISILLDTPPYYLRIQALEKNDTISGYLYLFREIDSIFTEVSSALTEGRNLNELLERFETGIIARIMKENGYNVSHTAKALGLRRSTLQNRIRLLAIDSKYPVKPEGPIRRGRKMKGDEQTGEAAVKESMNVKGSARETPSKTGQSKKRSTKRGARTAVTTRKGKRGGSKK